MLEESGVSGTRQASPALLSDAQTSQGLCFGLLAVVPRGCRVEGLAEPPGRVGRQLCYRRGDGGQAGGAGPAASFIYSARFHSPAEMGAPRRCRERALCLCIQAFQGLLQKVGAPGALKGLFVTGSLAWGGREGGERPCWDRGLSLGG